MIQLTSKLGFYQQGKQFHITFKHFELQVYNSHSTFGFEKWSRQEAEVATYSKPLSKAGTFQASAVQQASK